MIAKCFRTKNYVRNVERVKTFAWGAVIDCITQPTLEAAHQQANQSVTNENDVQFIYKLVTSHCTYYNKIHFAYN